MLAEKCLGFLAVPRDRRDHEYLPLGGDPRLAGHSLLREREGVLTILFHRGLFRLELLGEHARDGLGVGGAARTDNHGDDGASRCPREDGAGHALVFRGGHDGFPVLGHRDRVVFAGQFCRPGGSRRVRSLGGLFPGLGGGGVRRARRFLRRECGRAQAEHHEQCGYAFQHFFSLVSVPAGSMTCIGPEDVHCRAGRKSSQWRGQ